MPKLIIVLDVDADRTVSDPWEIANEALDITASPDQNHPFGAMFFGAEWADNFSSALDLVQKSRA